MHFDAPVLKLTVSSCSQDDVISYCRSHIKAYADRILEIEMQAINCSSVLAAISYGFCRDTGLPYSTLISITINYERLLQFQRDKDGDQWFEASFCSALAGTPHLFKNTNQNLLNFALDAARHTPAMDDGVLAAVTQLKSNREQLEQIPSGALLERLDQASTDSRMRYAIKRGTSAIQYVKDNASLDIPINGVSHIHEYRQITDIQPIEATEPLVYREGYLFDFVNFKPVLVGREATSEEADLWWHERQQLEEQEAAARRKKMAVTLVLDDRFNNGDWLN